MIHYTGEVADALADYTMSSFSSFSGALFGRGEHTDSASGSTVGATAARNSTAATVQEHNVKVKVTVEKVELLTYPRESGIKLFPPEEAIERARSRLGEKEYGLFKNNCECFVNWAITGMAVSNQSEGGRWATGIGALLGAVAGYKREGFSGLAIGALAGAHQSYQNFREKRS